MRSTPCPRLFELEAARDGRLTGAERASFERHMIGCPACLREAKALEGLAEALRASPRDDTGADELHVRRKRTRLLAAFDRTLTAPEHRAGDRGWLLWPASVAAVVACALVLWRVRPDSQPVHAGATVHADRTALWSESRNGNREEVDLARGVLWIHVDHSFAEGRLLVVLPDGELEDVGTTFTVSVEDGHTTRVAVEEGRVLLRIHGRSEVVIGPGDTWMPEPRTAASALASGAPLADMAPAARLAAAERNTPSPPLSAPVASAPASNPSVDFRAAMAALDVGDNHQAAAAFANFLEKHPRDARAEDAAYLRVIALQRSGDSAGTKQAALEYLRRYPAGFRQTEVEPLSR
jgi:hypothetical protein